MSHRDVRVGLTQKQSLAIMAGRDPWKFRSKFHDKIVHQISVETDGVPNEIVVFICGRIGDDDVYGIGAACFFDGHLTEKVVATGMVDFAKAVSAAELLSQNSGKLTDILCG